MIYVVEFPRHGRPASWFAFDREDFARKVYATDKRKAWEIFDVVSARELLGESADTADDAALRAEFPALCALADQHGWDAPLYRADYLLGTGVLQAEAVSEAEACVAALSDRLKCCRIYWSDSEATAALEHDAIFDGLEGLDGHWAREALREQLVALEIVEGPQG